jgi:chloramphenicol 3-O-phosphotransferase
MSGALILIGGPGSGKSSVLDSLSTMLEIDDVQFGAIETEQLARGWPWLSATQWMPQLEAVIELQRRAGRRTFLVAATTETEQELRAVVDAVGAERVVVVCLSVSADLAACRVARREPDSWPGKLALVEHARKLAREIPSLGGIDLVLSTVDRQAAEVATEVKKLLTARGILSAA